MQRLVKIEVTDIFLTQDMRQKLYIDLYEDAMLVAIQMGNNMAAGNQQKHLSLSFASKT